MWSLHGEAIYRQPHWQTCSHIPPTDVYHGPGVGVGVRWMVGPPLCKGQCITDVMHKLILLLVSELVLAWEGVKSFVLIKSNGSTFNIR